jgi:hypothetical protein
MRWWMVKKMRRARTITTTNMMHMHQALLHTLDRDLIQIKKI